jgi:hypothetical protein
MKSEVRKRRRASEKEKKLFQLDQKDVAVDDQTGGRIRSSKEKET